MLYEFQVFYRPHGVESQSNAGAMSPGVAGVRGTSSAAHSGPLPLVASMIVRAATPNQARHLVESSGAQVIDVGPGYAMVDWSKPMLTLQEAAALLGVSERTVRDWQAAGMIPKPRHDGRTLLRIEDIERYRAREMQPLPLFEPAVITPTAKG